MKKISVENAPRYLIIANGFISAVFILPVIMLFYGYKGVSTTDFFLIQGLCSFLVFALEIPTGYLGDLFSRKKVSIIGLTSYVIAHLLYIFGYGFWWMLTAELFFALAYALLSGTIEAYLYDLLKRNNKEKNFHNKLAKMESVTSINMLVAVLSGAFIYQYLGPNFNLCISVVLSLISITLLMFLPDVPESRRVIENDKTKLQDIKHVSKYAIKHPEIKWLIFYPAIYGSLTAIIFWGLQFVLISTSMPVFMFSLVFGAYALCRIFWANVSGKILSRFGLDFVIKISNVIIVLALLGASLSTYIPLLFTYICLGFMIIGSASFVLITVVTSTLTNHRIKSDERATVLSVKSMMGLLCEGLLVMSLKPLLDSFAIGEVFIMSALLIIPIIWFSMKLIKMDMKISE